MSDIYHEHQPPDLLAIAGRAHHAECAAALEWAHGEIARTAAQRNEAIAALELMTKALRLCEAEIMQLRVALQDLLTGAEQHSQSHVDVAAKCRAALAGPGGGAGGGEG